MILKPIDDKNEEQDIAQISKAQLANLTVSWISTILALFRMFNVRQEIELRPNEVNLKPCNLSVGMNWTLE